MELSIFGGLYGAELFPLTRGLPEMDDLSDFSGDQGISHHLV